MTNNPRPERVEEAIFLVSSGGATTAAKILAAEVTRLSKRVEVLEAEIEQCAIRNEQVTAQRNDEQQARFRAAAALAQKDARIAVLENALFPGEDPVPAKEGQKP